MVRRSSSPRVSTSSASFAAGDTAVETAESPLPPHSKQSPSYLHAKQIHLERISSPLSQDAPVQDYKGFQNLLFLLLFVNNFRLVVENYLKYGFLITLPGTNFSSQDIQSCLVLLMLIPLSIPISLWIESFGASYASYYTVALVKKTSQSAQLLSQRQQVEGRLQWAHYLLLLSLLFLPNLYCFWYMEHPAIILLPVLLSVILVLKLSSFMWVNHDLRAAYMDGQPVVDYGDNVTYPRNVTFGNIAYFIFAPTLCYQPAYPRNDRFRSSFFAKRVLELLTLLGVMYFLSGQYVVPTLRNSLKPFAQLNLFALLERLLKLSIPSIYCWLIMFYGVFHSYLNIWAELLRFGDRQFYKPWWNASTIGEYWRLWNLPVYQWFKRHIYLQVIIKHRKPAWVAGVLAFFISAIGHEILVGIPTHSFEGWAFLAMMGQIPLIAITELVNQIEQYGFRHVWRGGKKSSRRSKTQQQETKQPVVSDQQQQLDLQKEPAKQRKHGSFGNYFFWISFCILGQPLSILLYYRSYLMRSHPELIQNT